MTQVQQVVVRAAQRGLRLQLVLRGVLALFVVTTLLFLPPDTGANASRLIAGGYVVTAVAFSVWLMQGSPSAVTWGWLGLYVDLAALFALVLLADQSAAVTWTSYVLQSGFFLIPVLAATELRWWICTSVVVPTVALYTIEAIVTQDANDGEPWASIMLRVLVLAGVGLASIWLSIIQRSRVQSIRDLVADRTLLLADLMHATETEHRAIAEHLHDGALQYVLAARLDLEDAREGDEDSFERLDRALTQTAQLLRSTVSELHPAVLEQSGLALAVGHLVSGTADRSRLIAELDTAQWPADLRTDQDQLLFGVARELINNVVRHARASTMTVRLAIDGGRDRAIAELAVRDDGIGMNPHAAARKLADGHIGIASQRVKVESVNGSFQIDSPAGGGTSARVRVPVIISSKTGL